jgi:hypothetical protein
MTEIVNAKDPHVLVHEGGFEGFLSAVFASFRLRLEVERIEPAQRHAAGLFETVRRVETDSAQAARVREGMRERGGEEMVSMVRAALLSELPDIETKVWRYLKRVFGAPGGAGWTTRERALASRPPNGPTWEGRSWRNVLDPDMHAIFEAARKTCHEAHRFQGFARFSQAPDGSLFAVIAPDHDILELLAPHFRARFPSQEWSIFDETRGRCLRHREGEVAILEVDRRNLPKDSRAAAQAAEGGEERFRELWKAYYRATNLAERANPKLLRRNLPAKYWRYLPEREAEVVGKKSARPS